MFVAVVVVGFLLLVVGCVDVLMCCDADGLLMSFFQKPKKHFCFNMGKTGRKESAHEQFPRIRKINGTPVAQASEAKLEKHCVSSKNVTKYCSLCQNPVKLSDM